MPTLNWIGKDAVVNHHNQVPFRTLEKKYTFGDADSDNMIIHGDNLEALKTLLPKYEGRIKCIYIDPPYNTGASPENGGWVYYDNVDSPKIHKWLGQVVGPEAEDLTRHDKWLCMMYPRLKLLHKLLSNDGAIFISIDDNEQANLKLICDDIFGVGNFVACVANVNNPKGRSDKEYIASAHEYILIYRKSEFLKTKGFEPEEHITKRYNKKDKDGKLWREIDLRKTGDNDLRTDRPNMYYPIYWNEEEKKLSFNPQTNFIEILPMKDVDVEGCWRWERKTAMENSNRLYARYMPNKKQWSVFEMDYFDENDLIKPISAWTYKDVNSERGTEVFVKYLGFQKSDFPNPKPIGTIERVLRIASDKDSIILDSFAGSGTTAHAVLNLNKQDGGNRKFILVEMEDYAENITAERVRRVINGYSYDEDNETTLYTKKLTVKNTHKWETFIEESNDEEKASEANYDKVVKRIEDNTLKVVGITKAKGEITGTGGGFTFYELGEPIFGAYGYLNETVGTEKLREYLWYTETHEPYNGGRDTLQYLLGTHNGTDYYFYYEPNRTTTLDKAFLNTIAQKAEQYVIYADNCLLADSFMQLNHIVFKKIPRDIRKF